MADSRPKRKSAAKADEENKRIAVAAMVPIEGTDLMTQDDVVKRESPAPLRRVSASNAESPSEKRIDRSLPDQTKSATPGLAQVRVVKKRKSRSTSRPTPIVNSDWMYRTDIPVGYAKFPSPWGDAPLKAEAQNDPPRETLQQLTFARPRTSPTTAGRNPHVSRLAQQPLTQTNTPQLGATRPSPQVQNTSIAGSSYPPLHIFNTNPLVSRIAQPPPLMADSQVPSQFHHLAGPDPGPYPASKPSLKQQVVSMNQGIGQQQQQNPSGGTNFQALAHSQPTNPIDVRSYEAGPAHRDATKSTEGTMTSQTPISGQQVQHDPRSQTSDTAQLRSVQVPANSYLLPPGPIPQPDLRQQGPPYQSARPRTSSFPPGRPAGLANITPPKTDQYNGVSTGPSSMNTTRPTVNTEVPEDLILRSDGPQTTSASLAVPSHGPDQPSEASGADPQRRANSEAPSSIMLPPPARRRSNTADAAISTARVPVASLPSFSMSPPSQPGRANYVNGNPLFNHSLPSDVAATRPRFKHNYDPNFMARDQLLCHGDAAVSQSLHKGSRPMGAYYVAPIPLFREARPAPTVADRLKSLMDQSDEQAAAPSQPEYGPYPGVMSDQEPLFRQRNLDFQYKPDPPYRAAYEGLHQRQENTPAGFDQLLDDADADAVEVEDLGYGFAPGLFLGSNNDQAPPQYPQEEEENNQHEKQKQKHQSGLESLEYRFKARNDASIAAHGPLFAACDGEFRGSELFLKTLENLKIGRALDKSMASDNRVALEGESPGRPVPACLAVTLLPASTEVAIRSQPQALHEMMAENDDDGCVFCRSECSFGIADSRVWLPEEASIGYCADCHEKTQEVFRLWEWEYKLPHGLDDETKDKYKVLLEKQATTPLKELGDTLNYKSQHQAEMSRPARQDAITNASKIGVKDGNKDRREQREEISGGDLAASRKRRGSESLGTNTQRMGFTSGKVRPGPSALNTDGTTLTPSDPELNQATQTGWTNGAPSALPSVAMPVPRLAVMRQAKPQTGAMTPNSEAFMGLLHLSSPPLESGTASGSAPTIPSPTLSNTNTPASHDTSSRPPSTSAQPTGPSGIPRYFSAAPSTSFLQSPPISSNTGPSFCRGCPWRQIDFTKAKICTTCRDGKFLICSHTRHTYFRTLAELPGIFDRTSLSHGLGRIGPDGNFVADGRYSNCMVCTGNATHSCLGCPLRLCGDCVTKLTMLSKGKMNELLNCLTLQREHIRNDAFLLRSDNKGF